MNLKLILFTVLFVAGFGIFLYTRGRKSTEIAVTDYSPQALENLDAQIRAEKVPLSIDDRMAKDYAKMLLEAMKGWGTDEDVIYSIFDSLAGRADYLLIKKHFGLVDGRGLEAWISSEFNIFDGSRIYDSMKRFGVTI